TEMPVVPEKVIVPADEPVKPAPQVDFVAPGATIAAPAAMSLPPNPTLAGSQSAATPAPPLKPLPARRAAAPQAIAKAPAEVIPALPAENLQGRFSLSRQLGLGISRIVIDPGHGGHDPGAQTRGLNEADLVLDVALRLQQLLARTPGVEVILTR